MQAVKPGFDVCPQNGKSLCSTFPPRGTDILDGKQNIPATLFLESGAPKHLVVSETHLPFII